MLDTFRVQGLIDTDFMVLMVLQHAIEAAWDAVKDLLNPSNPTEARHLTLQFLTVMISGQVLVLMVSLLQIPFGTEERFKCWVCHLHGLVNF